MSSAEVVLNCCESFFQSKQKINTFNKYEGRYCFSGCSINIFPYSRLTFSGNNNFPLITEESVKSQSFIEFLSVQKGKRK